MPESSWDPTQVGRWAWLRERSKAWWAGAVVGLVVTAVVAVALGQPRLGTGLTIPVVLGFGYLAEWCRELLEDRFGEERVRQVAWFSTGGPLAGLAVYLVGAMSGMAAAAGAVGLLAAGTIYFNMRLTENG